MNIFNRLKNRFKRIRREQMNQKILKKNPNAAVVNYEVLKKKSKINRGWFLQLLSVFKERYDAGLFL